jgi:hypothetical protein
MRALDCFATHINNFRVIPRIVLLWLMHITWKMGEWAMHLPRAVTPEDVAMVGLFTGLFVAAFKFYLDTGGVTPTGEKREEVQDQGH